MTADLFRSRVPAAGDIPAGLVRIRAPRRSGVRLIADGLRRLWHVRGEVPLPAGQTREQAFERLDPLFREYGTHHERTGDRLTFTKKDPGAQDRMSVFEQGTLDIRAASEGLALRYHLISRSLLFCFAAPFLFLAIAQATVAINRWNAPSTSPAAKAEAARLEAKGKAAERRLSALPMNAIDKALGAPAPDKPGRSDKPDKGKKKSKQPTTTAAYVLAALFALLYVVGRILEPRLIRKTFVRLLAA